MPSKCILHLQYSILKKTNVLRWVIFTHYTGKGHLGTHLNKILKIITDTSVYDTCLLKTQCS